MNCPQRFSPLPLPRAFASVSFITPAFLYFSLPLTPACFVSHIISNAHSDWDARHTFCGIILTRDSTEIHTPPCRPPRCIGSRPQHQGGMPSSPSPLERRFPPHHEPSILCPLRLTTLQRHQASAQDQLMKSHSRLPAYRGYTI